MLLFVFTLEDNQSQVKEVSKRYQKGTKFEYTNPIWSLFHVLLFPFFSALSHCRGDLIYLIRYNYCCVCHIFVIRYWADFINFIYSRSYSWYSLLSKRYSVLSHVWFDIKLVIVLIDSYSYQHYHIAILCIIPSLLFLFS